ncbi:MAG: type II toxin-antitoxin system HicB family antitoxin [Oscillospiraceae bacterium]|nr:type II toxin-antitoxin system HicB family antitoxin [Oscillospiraceae bacterium]
MKYVYPAIFTPLEADGGYDVCIPDLPFVQTCGASLAEAIEMAEDAASMWLWDAENKKEEIPQASETLAHEHPQFMSMIIADADGYRRQMDSRAVKKTLTVPAWLNYQAEAAHVNFSSVLQEALKAHLHIDN